MPADTFPGGPGEITVLLSALEAGDREAADRLFVLVSNELRRLAGRQLRRGAGETLTPTALVHETYMKLGVRGGWSARDRVHFFALAARAMRQILVDRARERRRIKRGGGAAAVTLGTLDDRSDAPPVEDVLAVDRALSRLEAEAPELVGAVSDLLDADARASGFLEANGPLVRGHEAETGDDDATVPEGGRIGPYQILSLLGRGGMGEVYLAERADGQFEQKVALKLLDFGIAKLLGGQDAEATVTERGLRVLTPAYAAPELIAGEPVTTATTAKDGGSPAPSRETLTPSC